MKPQRHFAICHSLKRKACIRCDAEVADRVSIVNYYSVVLNISIFLESVTLESKFTIAGAL